MSAAATVRVHDWLPKNPTVDEMPQTVPVKTSLFRRWFSTEVIALAGKEVRAWMLPQPLGIALIIVLLGGVGSIYWRMNDRITAQEGQISKQNELLIRLDQRLQDKGDRDKEFREETNGHFESVAAWQQVTNKNLE